MEKEVRRIRADEWRTLRAFRLRALADTPDAFGSTLDRERDEPDAWWERTARDGAEGVTFLVVAACEGNEWFGMAWGHLPPEDPTTANLYAMWVAPEHRGRGHGNALVDEVARWASGRGAGALELRVSAGNVEGAALYRSRGFRDTGRRDPLREGSPIETLTMRRPLP